jgi:hypothetical protein
MVNKTLPRPAIELWLAWKFVSRFFGNGKFDGYAAWAPFKDSHIERFNRTTRQGRKAGQKYFEALGA